MINSGSLKQIKGLGTILSVWAHPDDETFTSAGIMHVAAGNRQEVICVTATKGEAGLQNPDKWPAKELGKIRAKELKAALEVLGVERHFWLGFKDGCCEKKDSKGIAKLADLIEKYQPDTILTFGRDGMTGHIDHCSVSGWVDEAVGISGLTPQIYHAVHTAEQYQSHIKYMDEELNIFFNIDEPVVLPEEDCDLLLKLDDNLKSIKLQALAQMPSQTWTMFNKFDEKFIGEALAYEAFILAHK